MRALGPDLPEQRPGCGSLSTDPNIADELAIRLGGVTFKSRKVEIGDYEDEHEACFDRDWTDGLPVVPPTPRSRAPHAAGDAARPQRGPGTHAARLRAVHGGKGGDQRGHGRLSARLHAGGDRRGGSGARRSRSACMPSSRRRCSSDPSSS